jgi:hypothetical protein
MFCAGAGAVSPLKAGLSFGTRPASIQLKLPLLTLSVGRTQPSTIHCFSVSRSVSKIPSIVLTRQTSGCALMGIVLWDWQVEVGLPSGWNGRAGYRAVPAGLNTKAPNLPASTISFEIGSLTTCEGAEECQAGPQCSDLSTSRHHRSLNFYFACVI